MLFVPCGYWPTDFPYVQCCAVNAFILIDQEFPLAVVTRQQSGTDLASVTARMGHSGWLQSVGYTETCSHYEHNVKLRLLNDSLHFSISGVADVRCDSLVLLYQDCFVQRCLLRRRRFV